MSDRDGSTRYEIPDEVIGRSLGEDLLVHCFDTDEVYVLNGDARLVFEALKASDNLEAVVAAVKAQGFEDDPDAEAGFVAAVKETLEELVKLGAVKKVASEG